MFNKHPRHVEAKSISLQLSTGSKRFASYKNRRDAAAFKVVDVVHTARRATSSIS